MIPRAGSAVAALVLALPLVACASQQQASTSTASAASQPPQDQAVLSSRTLVPATGGPAARAAVAPIVIAISVDGLNPTALRRLGPTVPHYERLMREGASTLNARAAYELTDTLPNHTGMITGRPIRGSRGHKVTFNDDRPGSWLAKVAGRYVRGMFDIAHDRGRTTALYTSKSKFDFLDRSWNARHGARDRIGADNGRDKISLYLRTGPGALADRVVADVVKTQRAMTFWHISNPDAAGHAHGFMSARYLSAVRTTDAYLGRLLRALDARPAMKARTTIILTADHGGRGASHRDPTKVDNYRIPFLTWGRGVTPGADLYLLNPERRDPGTARSAYTGMQPVRNSDVADLASRLLGLPNVVTFDNRNPLRTR